MMLVLNKRQWMPRLALHNLLKYKHHINSRDLKLAAELLRVGNFAPVGQNGGNSDTKLPCYAPK